VKITILRTTIISIYLLLIILSLVFIRRPAVVDYTAPSDQFSAERAYKHVEVISQKPHPIGSDEHTKVREYIVDQIKKLGFEPEVQTIQTVNPRTGADITVNNVIVKMKGTNNSKAVLLAAHYDTTSGTLGASDDGAGVAVLLESLRMFSISKGLTNDIIFLFTDGEEVRSVGAQAFVDHHEWINDVGLVINVDTRGNTGVAYMYEMSSPNGRLIMEFSKAVPFPYAASYMYQVYEMLPNYSDFTVFKKAGLPGFNIGFIDGFDSYHSMTDTPENLDLKSVQHMASYSTSLIRHFGKLDLSDLLQGNQIFFNPIGYSFIHYPQSFNSIFVLLTIFLLVTLIWLLNKRGHLTMSRLFSSFFLYLAALALSSLVTILLYKFLLSVHPYFLQGEIRGGTLYPYHFATILAILNVITFFFFYRLTAKKFTIYEAPLGACVLFAICMIASFVYMNNISYLFIFPLHFILVGYIVLLRDKFRYILPFQRALIMTLFSVPAILLFVPMISTIFIALGAGQPLGPIILTILLLGITLPASHFMIISHEHLQNEIDEDEHTVIDLT
jgi:hypothetical protein